MVNEWTRDDLPSEDHLLMVFRAGDPAKASTYERGGIIAVLDAVLDHLRINPGPSAREERVAVEDLRRLRRAHEIVEQERDQARDERDKWEGKYLDTDEALHQARASLHEACKVAQSYKVDAYQATERAEAAEARTAPAVPLHQPDGTRMDASHLPVDADDDPAVFVVRESDIAAVEIERDKDQGWTIPGRGWGWVWHSTAEELRNYARENCDRAAACEAVARAIEAEQAVGPPDGHDVNARAGTVWLDGIDHTPDEAVDLARALLAAAEEARDGVDR